MRDTRYKYRLPLASPVERAPHTEDVLLCDMCVNRSRLQLLMAQQLLYGAYVVSLFQQVRRKAVPQSMHRYMLCYIRFPNCGLESSLQGSRVHMMPTYYSCARIYGKGF